MVILNITMVVICIAALSTLLLMRTVFRWLEMIVYYMVIVVAIEQTHSAIADNFKLIQFSDNVPAFFFFKMNQLIVIPIATLWLLFSFFHPRTYFLLKVLLLGVWFSALTGAYYLFDHLGIFTLTGWNWWYSLFIWMTVSTESLWFSAWFRKLLRKSDGRNAVPA